MRDERKYDDGKQSTTKRMRDIIHNSDMLRDVMLCDVVMYGAVHHIMV